MKDIGKKKVLIVASVASMIGQFNIPNIKLLQKLGYDVDVAANFRNGSTCTNSNVQELVRVLGGMDVNCYQVGFKRNALDIRAVVSAARKLNDVMEGKVSPIGTARCRRCKGKYSFIHTHSPVGGAVGRLVARKHGIRAIYTAHGFHFYNGAPLVNWLIYYPIEKALSYITDVLITINKEDYKRAKKYLHAKKTVYVPGVGVDMEKFKSGMADGSKKRRQLGLSEDSIMLLSVGELIPRKNHAAAIRALANLGCPDAQYFIIGKGELENSLRGFVQELGLEGRVHLLGFRTDVSELCQAADLFVFPSWQEGLPLALMEAIACRTPVICSAIRGNTDLVHDGRYLFYPGKSGSLESCLSRVLQGGREGMKRSMADAVDENYRALRKCSLPSVSKKMAEIFGGGVYTI